MFTGLIQETGRIERISNAAESARTIVVASPRLSNSLRQGDSICVSGVCLTALDIVPGRSFRADLADETVRRTSLTRLATGSKVNLELPTPSGAPLGGHIVQGHVDGVARLVTLERISGGDDWRLQLRLPQELHRYVLQQGSISVEGISLTVASIVEDIVTIAIIPHTYTVTNLHTLKPNDLLNIEVDVLARYAEKMLSGRGTNEEDSLPAGLTIDELMANGF